MLGNTTFPQGEGQPILFIEQVDKAYTCMEGTKKLTQDTIQDLFLGRRGELPSSKAGCGDIGDLNYQPGQIVPSDEQ